MAFFGKLRTRKGWHPFRRIAMFLMSLGVTNEAIAIVGMILGILGGVSFMATSEPSLPRTCWILGCVFCVLRIACLRIHNVLETISRKRSDEDVDVFFSELSERVSDAVTLIGFGFAASSDSFLGLAAALAATFTSYVRSLYQFRGAGKRRAASGPMTRIHRLILLSITSIIMAAELSPPDISTTVPQITLWVIIIGCIATILIRWLKLKEIASD